MDGWLPPGRTAAVVFTIDDVHPGRSSDAYEAGGDLDRGALRHVRWLLDRHPDLRVTLFTTADWRQISPVPTRRTLARVPGVRDRVHLAKVLRPCMMRLDRHPAFVEHLRSLPRTEIALHGLHHLHTGSQVPVEFQGEDAAACAATLREAIAIFLAAGLDRPQGMTPPAWQAPPALLSAMVDVGLDYVASARDIQTPPALGAEASMSGLRGVPLLAPVLVAGGHLVHLPTNFQATSDLDRAAAVVEAGGLLSVKAHIVKYALGHVQADGLDELYRNYLDALFRHLEREYGDHLWWATMGEVAAAVLAAEGRML